ncbi:uncharacterized protein C12orf45 homolog [Heterodontus francisci]|uniref:uncharacterized protein C12orf45 homolog n=1 Tax=Heterodontus francisci TaxID=7792 RepID=UPI00355C3570
MAASGGGESARSAELLSAGNGRGIEQKLLINAKHPRNSAPPRIERVPRSGVLDRLQSFLPQIAKANEELRRQMETSEPGRFDIENIEDCPDKVIEMNVSLFEMSDSDESEDEALKDEISPSDCESFGEVTEANLKLHRTRGQRKNKIEVLTSDGTE